MTRLSGSAPRHLGWAALVAAAAVVSHGAEAPADVPTGWLVVLGVLGGLSAWGSILAWGTLVALNAVLLASFLLLTAPIGWQLALFYGLVALALAVLTARRPEPARHRRQRARV